MSALLYECLSPCLFGVCICLQKPDVHIGFRIDNVHHHTVPGFSFFFGCVLPRSVVNEHINLLVLLEQLRELVLHIGALILIPSITSVGDQSHQSYLRLIT